MNKNLKKVLGLLLGISMLCAILPLPAMARYEFKNFNADGYIWLEETDYFDRNAYSNVVSGDIFSGGQVRALGIKNVPDENGWYIEYRVNVPKTDNYKVWVHGGRGEGVDWASPANLIIDGGEPLPFTEDTVTTWSAASYGLSYAIMYSYVEVNLTAGQHTFRYMVNEPAPRNTDGYYISAIDFMLIMPTSYTWTPSITEKPVNPNPEPTPEPTPVPESAYKEFWDGYLWLEETDCYDRNSYGDVVTGDIFSDGQARALAVQQAPNGEGYYMEFRVNVPKTDDYKIWVHGGMTGSEWASPSKLIIDETSSIDLIAEKVTTWTASSYGLNYAIAHQYADVNLTEGKHTIRYVIYDAAPNNTSWFTSAIDFMLIMPASYEWNPSISERPADPAIAYKEFHREGYLWLEETDYNDRNAYSNLVTNIDIFSGGGGRLLGIKNVPDKDGWYMDYRVNVPKTDTYRIWVHGGFADSDWTSPAKIIIDGKTYDCTDHTVTTYSASSYGMSYGISYHYIDVNLPKGKHAIRYVVNDVAPRNSSYYISAIDFMLIMPVNYIWTPSITVRPINPDINYREFHEDGYLWLEETDYYDRNAYSTVVSGNIFSEGGARALGVTTAPGEEGWYMDYRVNVPKTDNYRIWVHGGFADSDWTSPAKIVIDGVTYDCTDHTVTTYSASDYGLKYGISYQYIDVNLTEGKHTISYVINDVAPKNTSYYIGAIDFMLIMSDALTWTPSITERPVNIDFYLSGELNVRDTSVEASVYIDDDAKDADATVIVTLYDSAKELQNIQIISKYFSQEENTLDINMLLTRPVKEGDILNVFVWDDVKNLNPLSPKLTLGSKL